MNIVEVNKIEKKYGNKFKLEINFNLEEGQFLGLVGENGAGKTTLLRIVTGLLKPTSGSSRVFGVESKKIKKVSQYIGVVSQYTGLPDLLKVKEFLANECAIRNRDYDSIQKELEILKLDNYLDKKISDLSEGNKRKIIILKSLLHRPKLLIMDEPTVGIDTIARNEIWDYIQGLKDSGIAAIICSHYLSEIEQICDNVMFLNNGKVKKTGTMEELIYNNSNNNCLIVEFSKLIDEEQKKLLESKFMSEKDKYSKINILEDRMLLSTIDAPSKLIPGVVGMIYSNNMEVRMIGVEKKSLENIMEELYKQ